MGGQDEPPSIRLKNEGDEHWRAGQTTDAIIAWSRAIASHDVSDEMLPNLYSNRAAAHLKLGNGREAKNDADVCVLMTPDWGKGHMRLGKALMLLNKPEDALLSFRRAVELEPDNREYLAAVNDARYHVSSGRTIPPSQNNQQQQQQQHQRHVPRQQYYGERPPWYQAHLETATLWVSRNQRMIMQLGFIVVGVWFLLSSGVINMDAGIGGEVGTVIVVAGGVYAAHQSGMSPFQIMMMLNMLNRGGGRRRRRGLW